MTELANGVQILPGERYEAEIPDTLDLAERCALAARGMAWSVSDATYDHEPYSQIDYDHRTPYASFGNGIGLVSSPKYAEALPMLRCASGSEAMLEAEAAFMRAYLARLGPDDGLHYMTRVTPFSKKDRPWHNAAYGIPEGGTRITDQDMADMYLNSRHVLALMARYERSGDDAWLPVLERAVRGLADAAIKKDDYAYYPDGGIGMPYTRPRSGWTTTQEARVEQEGGEGSMFMYHGGQMRAFTRYYEMTGDEQALDMAQRLRRYLMKARFWGAPPFRVDGSPTTSAHAKEIDFGLSPVDFDKSVFEALVNEPRVKIFGRAQAHWMGHAHGHLSVLRGLLQLGHAIADDDLIRFVHDGYEFSLWWLSIFAGAGDEQIRDEGHVLDPRSKSTSRIGAFGETCALADLVALAVRLSDYGVADYWDDVDRWVRNNLVERQITDPEALLRVSATCADGERALPDSLQTRTDDVIPGSLGLYSPNTLVSKMIWRAIGPDCVRAFVCCSCNGTQALYYAWESIVRKHGDWVHVNLLLNRASPWVDVDSYMPHQGKVVLRNKAAQNLRVRMPVWARPGYLIVRINGEVARVERHGDWLELRGLTPSDVATLEFPMRQTTEHIGERAFTFRGHTLCKIEPRADDDHYPIYMRDRYLQDDAPMKRVARYVPNKTLTW